MFVSKKMECQTRANDGTRKHGHQRGAAKGGTTVKNILLPCLFLLFMILSAGIVVD